MKYTIMGFFNNPSYIEYLNWLLENNHSNFDVYYNILLSNNFYNKEVDFSAFESIQNKNEIQLNQAFSLSDIPIIFEKFSQGQA